MLNDIFNNILIIISLCASESTYHNLSIEARVITNNIFEFMNWPPICKNAIYLVAILWNREPYTDYFLYRCRYLDYKTRSVGAAIIYYPFYFIGIRFVLNARNLDPSVVHS